MHYLQWHIASGATGAQLAVALWREGQGCLGGCLIVLAMGVVTHIIKVEKLYLWVVIDPLKHMEVGCIFLLVVIDCHLGAVSF